MLGRYKYNSDNNSDTIVNMRNASSYFKIGNELAFTLVFIPTLFEPEANFNEDFQFKTTNGHNEYERL